MKLHYLRYFSVLAEELHFGRAAARLAITQPPLSVAIKALEDELEVQLLLRTSKHVELTPAGAAFLDETRQILERVDRAGSIAKSVAKGIKGRLDIGIAGSLVYREVPAIVQEFGRAMPGIDIVLREMATSDQLQELIQGQLHVGFVNASTVPPQLKSFPLKTDDFVLCLPKTHPFADRRVVDLAKLENERFVMFSRELSPANYDSVIAIFSRVGVHPQTVHAARQWLTVVAMVAQGLGVSVVPRSLARSRVDGVKFVRLSGPSMPAAAAMVWNPTRPSAAMESFVESAKRLIQRTRPSS